MIVKRYKNEKFTYYIHEMYTLQAKKLLGMFDNDYQAMVDACLRINTKKGLPPVDFSLIDRYLYSHASSNGDSRIAVRLPGGEESFR